MSVIDDEPQCRTTAQESIHQIVQDIDIEGLLEGHASEVFTKYISKSISEISITWKELLWKFQPQPPQSLLFVKELRNLGIGLEYVTENDGEFVTGCTLYSREACFCDDLYDFLSKSKEHKATPVYIASQKYMTLLDSIEFLMKWLKFQFPKLSDRTQFVTQLFNWINLIDKKKQFLLWLERRTVEKPKLVLRVVLYAVLMEQ